MNTNEKGQVINDFCKFCGQDSTVCVGRCTNCRGHCTWDESQGFYECPCGESVLKVEKILIRRKDENDNGI